MQLSPLSSSKEFFITPKGNIYSHTLFLLSLSPWQPLIYFLLYGFTYFGYFIYMEICDLLCLASFIQDNVSKVHPCCSMHQYSFICWITYATFSLSFHQLMDIWLIFTFWLLWVVLLYTFTYKFLCGLMFSTLWGIYLGVELLDHILTLHLTFWGTTTLVFTPATPLHSHKQCMWVLILSNACYLLLFIWIIA